MHYDVVIVGGGFAGAYAARTLGAALGRRPATAAIVSESNVITFQPMLAEVAGSSLGPADVVEPLRHFCRRTDVLQGRVTQVEWAQRRLHIDGGRFTRDHQLTFGHLVLCCGSVTDLSRVPGMSEYARPMRTVADALRLRAAVINRFEEANLTDDEATRRRLLTFVVVGGGYTGVETAGQLLDFARDIRRWYKRIGSVAPRVILVHSQAELLAEIGPRLGAYARSVLQRRGTEVVLGRRVVEATARKAILDDGSVIEAHTIVSSIGAAPHPLVLDVARQVGVETVRGKLPVEPTLAVAGVTGLWAAGDCAAVPDLARGGKETCPPTAQFAQRQGEVVGSNLAAVLAGRTPREFRHRSLGQLATIGDREAVAEVMGLHFRGFLAWWMWRTIYLAKLPGLVRRLRVMVDWTFDLFFARDLSLVLPPAEDLLRPVHLEKGEALFAQGDLVRAHAVIRRGRVEVRAEGQPPVVLGPQGVLDDTWATGDGLWRADAVALEPTDAIILRGAAFDLFRRGLRLAARS